MKHTVNPKEVMLDNILAYMATKRFSQREAIQAVGGKDLLMRLISDGKIEADKPSKSQNGKWRCNAAQVLQHCRNMRQQ